MTKTKTRVTKGMTFRSHYADANPLWEVKKSRGQGIWICEIIDCADYSGVTKPFTREDILRCAAMEDLWNDLGNDHDSFYASLTPGQIIHYNNGFNNFVRCEVVTEDGENKLKPIALVGEWRNHDLPKRHVDGSIDYGYYPSMILGIKYGSEARESFTPNFTSIHEAKPREGDIDPTNLEPLDLSVPPMTDEEKATAAKWQKVAAIRRAIENGQRDNNPQRILDAVGVLISQESDGFLKVFAQLTGTPL